MPRKIFCTGMIALSLLVFGCGTLQTYPGEKLPPDQIAILLSDNSFFENSEIVSYTAFFNNRAVGDYESIELLPGEHIVSFGLKGKNFRGELIPVKISVEAGKTYASRPIVQKNTRKTLFGDVFKDGTWNVEIYDTTTNEIVGSSRPSEAGQVRKDPSVAPVP